MAEDQEIVRIRGDLELIKVQIADLRTDAARTEVIAERVTKEIVPAMLKLTDAVSQLYTKQSIMAFKLGAIASAIAAGITLAIKFLMDTMAG